MVFKAIEVREQIFKGEGKGRETSESREREGLQGETKATDTGDRRHNQEAQSTNAGTEETTARLEGADQAT